MNFGETMTEDSIQIPDYIEGIPTDRKKLEERFRLIQSYFDKLWKEIQREFGGNYIHNAFLDTDVYVVKNESDKKTVRQALYNWQSTYAVKHLRKVVEEAGPLEGMPLFVPAKKGVQKKNGYKNMVILYYTFVSADKPYLNFTAKLTIGITATQKHIQYSVNKVEVDTK